MKNKKLPKLIVILGPTASGKTDLAIKLALRLSSGQAKKKFGINGVEIVSADSRQVYKEMNIGTAKPPKQQATRAKQQEYIIQGIPHYLIDVVYPNQEFNVALYKKMVLKAIRDIHGRGKIPFLVGGTGLYIQAIVDNIEFPKVLPQKELRAKLEKKSVKELFEIYKKLDSKGAKFIESKNKRRLIRAIEVCKITKKPFWQQRKKGKPIFNPLIIGIKLPKENLKKRIKIRVEKMFTPLEITKAKKKHEKSKSLTGFKSGLEKEVKKLVKKYGWEITPLQTIGYQEWKKYFKGEVGKKGIKEEIILHTIQFVRRQMTWFKKDRRIKWIKNYKEGEKLIKKFLLNKKGR
jgi:tRNA dimethylallyltransferase